MATATISAMNPALNAIWAGGMPERIERSDTHSEKRASSAQLAATACTPLAATKRARPNSAMPGPSAASASASARMPPMLASSDCTVRRKASTRSDPFSMAASS